MNARQPGRSPASKLETVAINSIALMRERERGELLAYGVQFVEVTSDEDLTKCARCRSLSSRILPLTSVPQLPIEGCSADCSCRLAPVHLE